MNALLKPLPLIALTSDARRIKRVFCDPLIWPHICDDGSADPAGFEPPIVDGVLYFMPDTDTACFMLHRHTSAHWEAHSAVLPQDRPRSLHYTLAIVDWMRENTDARVISTYVPRGNFAAAALAKATGFLKVGIVPKSIVRNGHAVDQTLYARELR